MRNKYSLQGPIQVRGVVAGRLKKIKFNDADEDRGNYVQ